MEQIFQGLIDRTRVRQADSQGVHQRRTHPSLRGDRSQHGRSGLWTSAGSVPENRRSTPVLAAALALACSPDGFTASQFSDRVRSILGTVEPNYDARRAAYDLKKLRGKDWVRKIGRSRRYCIPPQAIRAIGALVTLRDNILRPILAGVGQLRPSKWSSPSSSAVQCCLRRDLQPRVPSRPVEGTLRSESWPLFPCRMVV